MKRVAVLGSTGSIGTQTLDVIGGNLKDLKVESLVAYSDKAKLERQAAQFGARYCALISVDGEDCLKEAVKNCDIAVVATKGICAIDSILYCLDNGIDVAIANKEALVCAGKLIADKLKNSRSKLLPVDSEHYAISQCISNRRIEDVSKLLLTASGGPFWETETSKLSEVKAVDALKHPNWKMGQKITVDSATMMNKALEVIEARWLFGVEVEQIEIVVHRQSVVHSMVEFSDGSIVAQLSNPDMRIPIQASLLDGARRKYVDTPDLVKLSSLSFEKCDFKKFPCSRLGYEIFDYPPLCATVMNAANDVCVEKFLSGELSFTQFYNIIVQAVNHFEKTVKKLELSLSNIKLYDSLSRVYTDELIDGVIC